MFSGLNFLLNQSMTSHTDDGQLPRRTQLSTGNQPNSGTSQHPISAEDGVQLPFSTEHRKDSASESPAKDVQLSDEHHIDSGRHNVECVDDRPDQDLSLGEASRSTMDGPELADASQSQAAVTIHIAPAMAPDLDIDDEGYAESTTTSYVTSIASEVSRGILENDRVYPQYGEHNYGMPVDEEEMDRMDLQHRKYEMVLGGRHFLAPIGGCPQKILDLGTGTGIWALDVADMFPSASVTGVDIAPIQPKWVAPNCQFEIDDIEASWTWKPDSFDFIHLRDPLLTIRDWPKLIQQIYDHLKPGGWCELACIHPEPTSDDGSMPPDSGFKLICDKLMEASALFGTPLETTPMYHRFLRDAGFLEVTENVFKIPSSPWPKDKRLKKIGALEMMNVIAGATAFGLRAFEQVFGWSKLQTEVAVLDFKRDVKNRNYHQYCPYYVVYARKPPDSSSIQH